MKPSIISGGCSADDRGKLLYNNTFDASAIKRIYIIENNSAEFVRAWQGHKIEQRWFSAVAGSFAIRLIGIDNWQQPSVNLAILNFTLEANTFDVLHIPAGYVSSIQALTEGSKLLVMADFAFGAVKDEYRFDADFFAGEPGRR